MIRTSRSVVCVLGTVLCTLASIGLPQPGHAQTPSDQTQFGALTWRNVGPFRGGRATTAVGVPGNNLLYYMGSTGGGVWKTEDGGQFWANISDGFFNTGSIGDIAVYKGDPNIIYVGTGEAPIRGQMSSYGDGMYKSTDAGKTWTHIGLEKSWQISRVVIHPTNPNIVYVSTQGSRWAPTEDRGVYRTTDGGATWKKILFSSNIAGASDVQMDPTDPNVLYAAFWDVQRFPWTLRSGGPGSGIWKSIDGGDHWTPLKTGLPKVMGKIRLAIAPSKHERVYAAIENEKSGLFVSDDAGATWRQVNEGAAFATRPFYYTSIAADPKDAETVYLSSASLIKTTDGGKTFTAVKTQHSDTHTTWINPADPKNFIETDDGGGEITFDGGKTWSPIENQPTAQFYNVRVDDLFPYNLYGGQQDNTTLKVPSRAIGKTAEVNNWTVITGNEAARPSFDPKNPRFVYTTNQLGAVTRVDMESGYSRDVSPSPGAGLGVDADQMSYRFEWSPPSTWSPFDASTIYLGANVLFRTRDQGVTWDVISPDLTRNEKNKHGRDGLFFHDGSGGEVYNTIYAIGESPIERGTIWVGTDDGLIQITRDDGKTWTNTTPKTWAAGWVYTIKPSYHDKATAYAAISRHRTGDQTPYFYKTTDYGKTWTDLATTLPQSEPARVVREDPVRKDLLYAATEYHTWVSFDGGAHWRAFQQNLPHVPVTDLIVHDNDLVASTEGRGFWIIDDVTTLEQMPAAPTDAPLTLYKPRDTNRVIDDRGNQRGGFKAPTNPPAGVIIRYALADAVPASQTFKLDILDAGGSVVRSYVPAPPPEPKKADETAPAKTQVTGDQKAAAAAPKEPPSPTSQGPNRGGYPNRPPVTLATAKGLNQIVWDVRTTPPPGAGGTGPFMPSGNYTARMTLGTTVVTQAFTVTPDPRTTSTAQTQTDRLALTRHMIDTAVATAGTSNELQDVLTQTRALQKEMAAKPSKDRDTALAALAAHLQKVGDELKPPPGPSGPGGQLFLTIYPGVVDQSIHAWTVVDGGEGPVTQGERFRAKEVDALCAHTRADADAAMKADIPKINALAHAAGLATTVARHPGVAAPAAPENAASEGEEAEDEDRD